RRRRRGRGWRWRCPAPGPPPAQVGPAAGPARPFRRGPGRPLPFGARRRGGAVGAWSENPRGAPPGPSTRVLRTVTTRSAHLGAPAPQAPSPLGPSPAAPPTMRIAVDVTSLLDPP